MFEVVSQSTVENVTVTVSRRDSDDLWRAEINEGDLHVSGRGSHWSSALAEAEQGVRIAEDFTRKYLVQALSKVKDELENIA
jgi:hypothetical protein